MPGYKTKYLDPSGSPHDSVVIDHSFFRLTATNIQPASRLLPLWRRSTQIRSDLRNLPIAGFSALAERTGIVFGSILLLPVGPACSHQQRPQLPGRKFRRIQTAGASERQIVGRRIDDFIEPDFRPRMDTLCDGTERTTKTHGDVRMEGLLPSSTLPKETSCRSGICWSCAPNRRKRPVKALRG